VKRSGILAVGICFAAQTIASIAAQPLIIAHRGARAYRPEHSLASYELGIEQGADYVEPDIVSTKDNELVCRHDDYLGDTTDVKSHPEFAGRWNASQLTLAEIKTLRCIEAEPQRYPDNTQYNGQFPIATLQEVIDLVKRKNLELGKEIGIFPETKSQDGRDDRLLVNLLRANGYEKPGAKCYIQSFGDNLPHLHTLTTIPLVQNIGWESNPVKQARNVHRLTPEGLAAMRACTSVIALDSRWVINTASGNYGPDPRNPLLSPTTHVAEIHKAGFPVFMWTLSAPNACLSYTNQDNPDAEFRTYLEAGVDGVWTNNPDILYRVRQSMATATLGP